MQIDLSQLEARSESFRSQVCIIGAGIAGLTLAHRLAQQGIDVALLEAGGLALTPEGQQQVQDAELTGTPHEGTLEGRFRAFGGASLRWGGQLLPAPSALEPGWPISADDLDLHYRAAEKLLAVDDQPYDAGSFFPAANISVPNLQLAGTSARLSKWAPFSQRNMAKTLGSALLQHDRCTVYLNAQATELVFSPQQTSIEAVLVRSPNGHTYRFQAPQIIVAAGTVETVRLLLASHSVAPAGVGNQHDQVGRNFHDHLTVTAAVFTGAARKTVLKNFRPWAIAGIQRSIKFEASSDLLQSLNLNPILAHLTFEDAEDSGLAALRQILLARQRGNVSAAVLANLPHLPDAARNALWLWYEARSRQRRYIGSGTTVRLQLNAAQDARSASSITLTDKLDTVGMAQPLVDWRISPNELRTLRTFAQHLRSTLNAASLEKGIDWTPSLFQANDEGLITEISDARHPMGGACMGHDPRTSVVDPNLTVHGVNNLHIASAATFPAGSPQLITLPLMALTLRLADHLIAKL